MLYLLLDIFTYLLAAYGALYLIIGIFNSIRQRENGENSCVKLVLVVKNQEETIEGIIRNIYSGDILKKVMSSEKLSVLDMGSNDATVDILAKIRAYYGDFDIVNEVEKERIFLSFCNDESIANER